MLDSDQILNKKESNHLRRQEECALVLAIAGIIKELNSDTLLG